MIPNQITTRARRWGLALLAASLCLGGSPAASRADTFYPMVMSISPVAVQAGTTAECEVDARYNLAGTYRVFVTGDGVTAEAAAATERAPGRGRRRRRQEVSKI